MSWGSERPNPLDMIATKVPSLDLWQPRDWPHRRGDELKLSLHSMPLAEDSPGRRPHPCEHCGQPALCIHDNVLCWKCKGTFCLGCGCGVTGNINQAAMQLQTMSMDNLVQNGFGKCPCCKEPLRSIGLVDVFRKMIEMKSGHQSSGVFSIGGFPAMGLSGDTQDSMMSPGGSSLVQEAEDALQRGRDHQSEGRREGAILEYTHAINAINYLASSSNGLLLVLHAHDILLMAHGYRAELESNPDLTDAICTAYPKASVKAKPEGEQTWRLGKLAFQALFYPLPAHIMAGGHDGGYFVGIDLRTETREDAIKNPELRQQVELIGGSVARLQNSMPLLPHCDGVDPIFARLDGAWKGVFMQERQFKLGGDPFPKLVLGEKSVKIMQMIQFIRAFPTMHQAKEYTRVIVQEGQIGEEGPPLHSKHSAELTKLLKMTATKEFEVKDLHKVHVLQGKIPGPTGGVGATAISAIASIGNVSTKVFLAIKGKSSDFVPLVARALAYLEQQLLKHRFSSTSIHTPSSQPVAIHHPDLSICAFCGESPGSAGAGEETKLKKCSRCKLSTYCSIACQKKHWEMKGPFGHKKLCKHAVKVAASHR